MSEEYDDATCPPGNIDNVVPSKPDYPGKPEESYDGNGDAQKLNDTPCTQFFSPESSIIVTGAHNAVSNPIEMTVVGEILFLFSAPFAVIILILVECFYFSVGIRHLQDLERYLFGDIRSTFISLWTGISIQVQNAEKQVKEVKETYEKQEKIFTGKLWCAAVREKQLEANILAQILAMKEADEALKECLAFSKTLRGQMDSSLKAFTDERNTERADWEAKSKANMKEIETTFNAWKAQKESELQATLTLNKTLRDQMERSIKELITVQDAERAQWELKLKEAETSFRALQDQRESELTNWERDVKKQAQKIINLRAANLALEQRATKIETEVAALLLEEEKVQKLRQNYEVLIQEMMDESRVQHMCESSILMTPEDVAAITEVGSK